METMNLLINKKELKRRKPHSENSPFFMPSVQRKISIGAVEDAYEQEADATAEKVMRMSNDKAGDHLFFKPSISSIQRKCAHCEEEEKLQVQRKEIDNNTTVANTSTANYINSLNGNGRSLTQNERKFFEPRFGYDFSGVQLHTNSAANRSAENINALAYTHGRNIVFASNQYQPDTDTGKKLMAHELTHVVQQKKSNLKIQRTVSPTKVSCNAYPRSYPIFSWMGTIDPISDIQATDSRAIELLSSAIDQLNFVKGAISGGSPAAYPTITDCMAESIRTRLLIDPGNATVWTRNGVGTIAHFVRWLSNLKRTFEGGGVRYNCRGPLCEPDFGAYIVPGQGFLVNLCHHFWATTDVNIRALMLIHEFAHVYYDTEDVGRGAGSSYCIHGVVADLNDLHATMSGFENCGGGEMQAC